RGYLQVEGSHTLEHFVNGVAADIQDPETELPSSQRVRLARIASAASGEDRQEIRQRADIRIGALGSGSDYTAFLDHLGIASLNVSYGGGDPPGVFFSLFQDLSLFTPFF